MKPTQINITYPTIVCVSLIIYIIVWKDIKLNKYENKLFLI